MPVEPLDKLAVQEGGLVEKLLAGQLMVAVPLTPEVTSVVLVVAAGELMAVPAVLVLKAVHLYGLADVPLPV